MSINNDSELERLICAGAAGDHEALEIFCEKTRDSILRGICILLDRFLPERKKRNMLDAEDITQDTYVRVCAAADTYHAQGAPMKWLQAIARNCLFMWFRKFPGGKEVLLEELDAIPCGDPTDAVVDKVAVEQSLRALTDREREVFLRKNAEERTFQELAEMFETPWSTVWYINDRARKKLRAQLE